MAQPAGDHISFCGNGNAIHHLRTGLFVHKGIVSAIKEGSVVSDRMSYVILRGHWCDIVLVCLHQLSVKVMIQKTAFMRI
jgi:hypothetical protein